jgi:hypothetical protein
MPTTSNEGDRVDTGRESPIEQLTRLATRIDSNAAVAARPGQSADLEAIATGVRAVVDRLKSWEGLTALLDDRARTESQLRKELAATKAMITTLDETLEGYRYPS